LARKILLADDSVTAQNMGRKILADAGYEVITVNNGSAALKKIAEQKPDLIVLDVYMPGYSGLEVCQRLKETQETSRVPVLLTVGKLEPFKPEEAKRVRADGFIVKPFEASELLSALSKLEDKIVPRPEASKPGRFARVTASIEEGRYDKTVAIGDDLGWKDRISFPSKKKERAAQKHSDDPAAYDSPNNLHTVIQHKLADKPSAAKAEEARVDLGALAPEGLPKDVTPEEIAALAAAAAQVKGKIAESRFAEPAPAEARTEETEQSQPAAAFPATFAEQKFEEKSVERIEEKLDAPRENSNEAAVEASMAPASPSDVIAAIAGLNPDAVASPGASLGNGFSSHRAADQTANEPVTMARAGSVGEAPHWTAVSVALGPEEAAISLEHEMQKAYAAFAAAEIGHAASVTATRETGLGSVELAAATESSTPPEAGLSEPVVSIPAMPAPEAAQTLSALANASTEAIRAAVQELEMVAESYVGETATPAPAGLSQLAPEAPQTVEAVAEESPTAAAEAPQPEGAKLETAKHDELDSRHEEPKNQEWKNQYPENEDRKNEEPFVAAAAAAPEEGYRTNSERREVTAPTFVNEVPAERTSSSQVLSDMQAAAAAVEPTAEGSREMAKKESDAAANTAAAWASWRRIRESSDPKPASEEHSEKESEEASTRQEAAMAVAAGAEKTPEEVPAESESDPAAIASIVDSVLADLRPKIFEEISRKMAKKK
jgi:CheY-like chemotaxis protein